MRLRFDRGRAPKRSERIGRKPPDRRQGSAGGLYAKGTLIIVRRVRKDRPPGSWIPREALLKGLRTQI